MILLALAARITWQVYPGIIWCSIFWAVILASNIIEFYAQRRKWNYGSYFAAGLAMIGVMMNATVTLANSGYMPVINETENHSIWITTTDADNLLFLADKYVGFSLGDFFIGGGIFLMISIWIIARWRRNCAIG